MFSDVLVWKHRVILIAVTRVQLPPAYETMSSDSSGRRMTRSVDSGTNFLRWNKGIFASARNAPGGHPNSKIPSRRLERYKRAQGTRNVGVFVFESLQVRTNFVVYFRRASACSFHFRFKGIANLVEHIFEISDIIMVEDRGIIVKNTKIFHHPIRTVSQQSLNLLCAVQNDVTNALPGRPTTQRQLTK